MRKEPCREALPNDHHTALSHDFPGSCRGWSQSLGPLCLAGLSAQAAERSCPTVVSKYLLPSNWSFFPQSHRQFWYMMLHIQRTTDLKDQKAGMGLFCQLCQHERHWAPMSHNAMVGDLVLCSCEVEALLCFLWKALGSPWSSESWRISCSQQHCA